jgi:hypothetical protein
VHKDVDDRLTKLQRSPGQWGCVRAWRLEAGDLAGEPGRGGRSGWSRVVLPTDYWLVFNPMYFVAGSASVKIAVKSIEPRN